MAPKKKKGKEGGQKDAKAKAAKGGAVAAASADNDDDALLAAAMATASTGKQSDTVVVEFIDTDGDVNRFEAVRGQSLTYMPRGIGGDRLDVEQLGYEVATKRILAAGWHMTAKEDGVALVSLLRRLKDCAAHAGVPSDIPTYTKKDVAKIVKEAMEQQQQGKKVVKTTTSKSAKPPPPPAAAAGGKTGPTLADPSPATAGSSMTGEEQKAQRRKWQESQRARAEEEKKRRDEGREVFEPVNTPVGAPRRHCMSPDSGQWCQGGCTREGFDALFGTDAAAQWRKALLVDVVDDGYGSPYGIPVETLDLRRW